MTLLEQARQEINAVDQEIAKLFERRMKAVESVIAYKLENDLPIFDSSREDEVIERGCARIEREELKPYFREFLLYQMQVSKSYQQSIVDSRK